MQIQRIMKEYANLPSWLARAYERCQRAVPGGLQSEKIPIEDAVLRVAAADVFASEDVPSVPLAAVEGYALRASDTAHANRDAPAELDFEFSRRILASRTSSPATRAIKPNCAVDVPPYFPLPENADAVAPTSGYEVASRGIRSYLRIQAPISPGQHVIAAGREYRKGDLLLHKGNRITAERQVALISAGIREVAVTKRPRIGVVIVGYEQKPPGVDRERWQRPDASGPYIRAVLRRWGYEVPPVEYIEPPDMTRPPLEVRQDEHQFKVKLVELAERYDLIVGAGLPALPPFQNLGLNGCPMYSNDETVVDIKQMPAGRFNFGRSENRSPPKKAMLPLTRPDGTQSGMQLMTSYDQATLLNLPGHTSSVAILVHTIAPRVLDLLEHVATPGPYWQTGVIAHDVERSAEFNGMRWGNLYRDANGDRRVHLLPFDGDGLINGVARAGVLVAIPAGDEALPVGSPVLFLHLDRECAEAVPCSPKQSEQHAVPMQQAVSLPTPSPAPGVESAKADLHSTWKLLEEWGEADATRLPGGFNGPAIDSDIAALNAALGVTLPSEFIDSLRMHNGLTAPGAAFADGEALLSAREIITQWSIWKRLVAGGDFDGMSSEPDQGIRDDWYNLKWIPFTHDGSGNHLCLDLDPAEGGTLGQVIRIWHDDEVRELVAGSFSEWLARVAAKLVKS